MKIKSLSNITKVTCMMFILFFMLLIIINIPTVAVSKPNNEEESYKIWDGSVASSYSSGDGSVSNPYVISTAEEFAYLSLQSETIDYEGVYFVVENDLFLNEGVFKYDYETEKTLYIIADQSYYLDLISNKYYDNPEFNGDEIGSINVFNPINNFKGILDGGKFNIYGLYLNNSNQQALFNNLFGDLNNINIRNAFIYSQSDASVIASTTTDANIKNIVVNATVLTDDLNEVKASGFVGNTINTTIENVSVNTGVYAHEASGLVSNAIGTLTITNSHSSGKLYGNTGVYGIINTVSENAEINLEKVYNSSELEGDNKAGIIGKINLAEANIENVFDISNSYKILEAISANINIVSLYSVNSDLININNESIVNDEGFEVIESNSLYDKEYVKSNLNYLEFVSLEDLENNPQNIWFYKSGKLPVLYIEKDFIKGYCLEQIKAGNKELSMSENVHITNRSRISLNFVYSDFLSKNLFETSHNLVSNISLPINTNIKIIDNINKKVYEYVVTNPQSVFAFTLFKEVGVGQDIFFTEKTYYNQAKIVEDFEVVLDFSDTEIHDNYEGVVVGLELTNSVDEVIRKSEDSNKRFNIYSTLETGSALSQLKINGSYESDINYNSDSTVQINVLNEIKSNTKNGVIIHDTKYYGSNIGVSIKLVDEEGNVVDREHLKSIKFVVDDNVYYPQNDNVVYIDLGKYENVLETTINIETYENNNKLKEGTYFFEVSNYVSCGKYYYELGTESLSVPVIVSEYDASLPLGFDVIRENSQYVINKNLENNVFDFDILQKGDLEEAFITVKLYKKSELTAFNQEYVLVDLKDYFSDSLTHYSDKSYYVTQNIKQYEAPEYLYNDFQLNPIVNDFENTGYKLVFDLYSKGNKVNSIQQHFIVRQVGVENEG